MKRILLPALAILAVAGCAKTAKPAQQANDQDTMTVRQSDSVLSTFPIPGASKIRDAQKAADKTNKQLQAFDTVH
jgi:outer membrane biogenesis lipoprotein LolB